MYRTTPQSAHADTSMSRIHSGRRSSTAESSAVQSCNCSRRIVTERIKASTWLSSLALESSNTRWSQTGQGGMTAWSTQHSMRRRSAECFVTPQPRAAVTMVCTLRNAALGSLDNTHAGRVAIISPAVFSANASERASSIEASWPAPNLNGLFMRHDWLPIQSSRSTKAPRKAGMS